MSRRLVLAVLTFAASLSAWRASARAPEGTSDTLPSRLSDQDFWRFTEEFSEPNGYFRSDNLLSNEMVFARVLPELVARAKPSGVYLGVGPEQNFTYIAAIRPKIAFITDIRRGNLHLQLMYKALFELSKTRADFLSRLFSRKRPNDLSADSTPGQLFDAYAAAAADPEEKYRENLKAIDDLLVKTHKWAPGDEDLAGIEYVYGAFYRYGPAITYSSSSGGAGRGTTYTNLMTQIGPGGEGLSYLGTEEKYRFMRDFESRNLMVPVVGNFAGPTALRSVGTYLKDHGATVTAFYVSNVEQYLRSDGIWPQFCANVASLPLDAASVFIRPSAAGGRSGFTTVTIVNGVVTSRMPPAAPSLGSPLGVITEEVKECR
jgi:hypothetical protein